MKKIGIIGGLGPESTVDYYKEIISTFNTKYAELAYPEIIVYSANLKTLMGFVETESWSELSQWLLEVIYSLHRAGAEFVYLATPGQHHDVGGSTHIAKRPAAERLVPIVAKSHLTVTAGRHALHGFVSLCRQDRQAGRQ